MNQKQEHEVAEKSGAKQIQERPALFVLERLVDILNDLLRLDRNAAEFLMKDKAVTVKEVAEHPLIQAVEVPEDEVEKVGGNYLLSMSGVLAGFALSVSQGKYVVAVAVDNETREYKKFYVAHKWW